MDQRIEIIKNAQRIKEIRQEIMKSLKNGKCLLCGKDCTYCNSHTIPKSMLKNIAGNGKVMDLAIKELIDFKLAKEGQGINEADTFNDICCECDSKNFKEYEDENNIVNFLRLDEQKRQVIMLEIFKKNVLRDYYYNKLNVEAFPKCIKELNNNRKNDFELQKKIYELDLIDQENLLREIKAIENSQDDAFEVIYFKKKSTIYPIALQANIAPRVDCNGERLNEVYNMTAKMHFLTICVFPFKSDSIVMVFCLKKDKSFFISLSNQLMRLKDVNKLKYLLALYLAHSDQAFFTERAYSKMKANTYASELVCENVINEQQDYGPIRIGYSRMPDVSRYKELPNLFK